MALAYFETKASFVGGFKVVQYNCWMASDKICEKPIVRRQKKTEYKIRYVVVERAVL